MALKKKYAGATAAPGQWSLLAAAAVSNAVLLFNQVKKELTPSFYTLLVNLSAFKHEISKECIIHCDLSGIVSHTAMSIFIKPNKNIGHTVWDSVQIERRSMCPYGLGWYVTYRGSTTKWQPERTYCSTTYSENENMCALKKCLCE